MLAKAEAQARLEVHTNILNDLDELGDIMTEMLERQQTVEVRSTGSSDRYILFHDIDLRNALS